MQKSDFQKTLAQVKAAAPKREFVEKYDFIINFKDLDLKVPENQKDLFIALPHSRGRVSTIAVIAGPELAPQAKTVADTVITTDQFPQLDKKKIKQLADKHDFFIAQANIMPEIAKVFGRVLGPRGKMPNPKAGCVVPPNANLKPLIDKLRRTVRLSIKSQLNVKTSIGKTTDPDEAIIENAAVIYEAVVKVLPKEFENIKNILLKTTMSHPVRVGGTA